MEALGFVFDLDDTLYAERDYVRSCFRWIGPRLGGGAIAEDLWRLFEAGERDPIGVVSRREGVLDVEKERLIDGMRGHAPELTLDSGAARLIERLRAGGRKFSIITNGRSITQRRKIEALGLIDAAAIIVSEEFGAAKPDAALFKAAAIAHPARRYLYVGDNPSIDFEGPNALGWMTMMLLRGDGVRREEKEINAIQRPQRVISSLEELCDLT